MSANFVPPACRVGPDWELAPSTYGVYMRNLGSGAGMSFETPEDAAAVEAGARQAREYLERQRDARASAQAVQAVA
jgi:hypothetical protein